MNTNEKGRDEKRRHEERSRENRRDDFIFERFEVELLHDWLVIGLQHFHSRSVSTTVCVLYFRKECGVYICGK